MADRGGMMSDERGRGPGNGDGSTAAATPAPPVPQPPRAVPPRPARLGEELPVFCERCGYSLHGLSQERCGACRVLHFSCPECDHHQPINTLRPAFQRMLGRLRSLGLVLIVFLKLNFFGWTLLGWGTAGGEASYDREYQSLPGGFGGSFRLVEPRFQQAGVAVLMVFGFGFGAVGRMLLLRWRRGVLVGLSLAAIVMAVWFFGAAFQAWAYDVPVEPPFNDTVLAYVSSAAAGVLIGASCVWGVWLALAHAFLPKRAAVALIDWQTAMSARDAQGARTDPTVSVTA